MRILATIAVFMSCLVAAAQTAASGCITCHSTLNNDIVDAYATDVHGQSGFSCESCHGGDPSAHAKESAKPTTGRNAYRGKPEPTAINQLCGQCHTDQLQALNGGNHSSIGARPDAPRPTCINCHDVHAIGRATPNIVGDEHCRDCHQGHFEKVLSYAKQLNGAHQNMRELRRLLGDLEASGRANADMRRAGEMAEQAFQRLKVSAHTADPSRVHEDALGIAGLFERALEVETTRPPRFKTVDGYLTSLMFGVGTLSIIAILIFIVRKRRSSKTP